MSDALVTGKPTVMLVHGAFADGSSWNLVIERLQAKGLNVMAPAVPLRGISSDAAYVAALLEETPGPVLAVGHSYGGAVISNAVSEAKNVVGIVFVCAFAPEEGQLLGEVAATSKDSVLMSTLIPHHLAVANGGQQILEFTIDPERFHDAFASDLPEEQAAVLAATQRPVAEPAFSEPSRAPAWKDVPSWAVIATGDKAAGTDITRSMAERAGSRVTEVEGSHLIMVSQPQAVTDVILAALDAVAGVAPVG